MMRPDLGPKVVVTLASLGVVLALVAAVATGALDPFASEGVHKRSAIGALLAYWFVFTAIVWLVPAALRHPAHAVLALVATAAALAAVEVGARVLIPGTRVLNINAGGFASRRLHHVYPAHTRRYMGRFEGRSVFLDTNEDGLRTSYSKKEFTRYDHRLIFLGDSFTIGMGVPSEQTFPSRVEAHLRQAMPGNSVAVLNAGIISHSPFLSKLLLEQKLAAYQPTLVVLVLDVTDIGDDYEYMNIASESGGSWLFPFEDAAPVRYRGAVGELLRPYYRRLASALRYPFELAGYEPPRNPDDYYDFEITIGTVLEKNRFFIYRHPLERTRHLLDRTLRNIDEIAGDAARLGARFALVIAPRYHHWNVRECPDNWEAGEYALAEPYQFEYFRYFDEIRREYPIINLLPDFRATDKYPLVFADDPHWNAAGHAFVGEVLTGHLVRLGLIRMEAGPTRQSTRP